MKNYIKDNEKRIAFRKGCTQWLVKGMDFKECYCLNHPTPTNDRVDFLRADIRVLCYFNGDKRNSYAKVMRICFVKGGVVTIESVNFAIGNTLDLKLAIAEVKKYQSTPRFLKRFIHFLNR